jgi:hypothetical protein
VASCDRPATKIKRQFGGPVCGPQCTIGIVCESGRSPSGIPFQSSMLGIVKPLLVVIMRTLPQPDRH